MNKDHLWTRALLEARYHTVYCDSLAAPCLDQYLDRFHGFYTVAVPALAWAPDASAQVYSEPNNYLAKMLEPLILASKLSRKPRRKHEVWSPRAKELE